MKLNIVPPGTGIQWVKLGIQTFFKQPLALVGLFLLYFTGIIALAQIPLVGIIAGGMLVPAGTLGLMAATEQVSKGRYPMPWLLISAFRSGPRQLRAMLLLGAIYAVGSLLISELATLLAGTPLGTSSSTGAGAANAPTIDGATLLALVLHIPLFLMFWHAPALVHWYGVAPTKSLFFSLVACLRNFGAFTIYILLWLVVFLATSAVFSLLGGLIGGPSLARTVIMPVALLLATMFSTSIFFTFRDSFVVPTQSQQQLPGESS